MKPSSTGVTQLLIRAGAGDRAALDEMLPHLYGELRRLANSYLSKERAGHTLQPTALVHEAYLRLIEQQNVDWKNRAQFFGLAAEMMRRILLNHARRRAANKREGKSERISLDGVAASSGMEEIDLIALDDALKQLSAMDSRKSRIVELKFFTGLKTEEIAEILQISNSTVEREWSVARTWLFRWVKGD